MRKILFLAVAVTGAAVASADTMTFTGTGLGQTGVSVTYTDSHGTATDGNVFAGQMDFKYGNLNISTLCVSLRDFISGGQSWQSSVSSLTPADGNLYLAGKVLTAGVNNLHTAGDWTAMQLAVWKSVYDGSNLAGTNFIVNSGVSNSILTEALGDYQAGIAATSANAKLYGIDATGGQPQISAQAVPEPATLAALGFGVVALIRRRRKA